MGDYNSRWKSSYIDLICVIIVKNLELNHVAMITLSYDTVLDILWPPQNSARHNER